MTRSTCEELLQEFRRSGARTYREAEDLLRECGFEARLTTPGHVLWKHPRGIRLTLPKKDKDLKVSYKMLVVRNVTAVQLIDE
jgi:predicted RNA binding protein YcfA (HicA-like mRNA interferase family)